MRSLKRTIAWLGLFAVMLSLNSCGGNNLYGGVHVSGPTVDLGPVKVRTHIGGRIF